VTVHDQVRSIGLRQGRRADRQQSAALVARATMTARVGRGQRDARGEIRMEPAERAYRERMAQHPTQAAIGRILAIAQSVTVVQQHLPRSDVAAPLRERVGRPGVALELVAAPAIVIAADPQHFYTGVVEVGQRRQHAEAAARHDVPPRKPEVEHVAHDHERSRVTRKPAQERQQCGLRLGRSDAQVGVADHVTWRFGHAVSLTHARAPDKRPGRPLHEGAWSRDAYIAAYAAASAR